MMKTQTQNTYFHYRLFVFLVFPILAFLTSVRKIHIKEHFWITLLFTVYFSYTYIPIPQSDATRYEQRFGLLNDYDWRHYLDDIQGMYDGRGMYQDAYIYTIQLFISPFTNNILVYRAVFGFIYFYIYLSIFRIMLSNKDQKKSQFNLFLLGLAFLISFTSGINGIRWPLALMVFILGSYQYIVTSRIKYILFASASILIHFISFYLVLFLFIYIVLKKLFKPKIFASLLLISFIYGSFFTNAILSNTNNLGDGLAEKTSSYVENEDYKKERFNHLDSLNWYIQFDRFSTYYFIFGAVILSTYFNLGLVKSSLIYNLQFFAILMFLASFISSQLVDVLSNRFYLSANAFGLIYLYHLDKENLQNKFIRICKFIYLPIFILHAIIIFRADLQTISPRLIFSNIFTEIVILG